VNVIHGSGFSRTRKRIDHSTTALSEPQKQAINHLFRLTTITGNRTMISQNRFDRRIFPRKRDAKVRLQ
jgi:hypothetical protein